MPPEEQASSRPTTTNSAGGGSSRRCWVPFSQSISRSTWCGATPVRRDPRPA